MTQLRAIIFDFDGTLADSYPAIAASVNHVREHHGLPPLAESEVRRHVGRGATYLLEHTVPGANPETEIPRYRQHHTATMRSGTKLLPDVGRVLPALRDAGFRLAVCSNKPVDFTRDLLGFLDIASLFEVVLGPEDVDNPKPAPDMLLAAVRRLNVSPNEVLYVGDMTVDIQTARAAGVAVWVIPTGSDERSALEMIHPDRIMEDFAELHHVIPGRA